MCSHSSCDGGSPGHGLRSKSDYISNKRSDLQTHCTIRKIVMFHCESSKLYRAERITEHDVQFRATMVVLMYFHNRYKESIVLRHKKQVLIALKHLEARLHQ